MAVEEKGAESNRPSLPATTMASANTYFINIWLEDTLSVPLTAFSHSNEDAIKEEKQQLLPQRDTGMK